MGLLDRFFKKDLNQSIFAFVSGKAAPDMKGPDFLKAYKGWVYACVNAISEEVATVNLRLQQFRNGQWVDLDNHIALQPLRQVNSFMSSSDLMLATQAYLELDGNAFWYLPKGSITAKPAEIWILDPTRVLIVKSQKDFIGSYVYRNEAGQDVPLTPQEVLHFKRFNPLNRYRGAGTVAAAAIAIDIDTFSAQWNKNFFYNAAVPSAVLETDGTLTEEQYSKIQAKWDSKYVGADNAHKLIILQGGMKFKPAQLSQKDMDFLEQRKFTRDEILGIFRVPKTILGITEDVNRANAEASEFVFAKRVVKPKMEFIVDRLNEFYLPLFGLNQSQFRFTFDDPVPQNVELQLKSNETALRAGYKTINEVREDEGLDPVQNGDEVLIPLSLVPLGGVINPVNPDTAPAKEVQKGFDAKTLDIIEKRVQFITSQIRERKPQYKKLIQKIITTIIDKLINQGSKSIKKDKIDDLLRVTLEDSEEVIAVVAATNKDVLSTAMAFGGKQALNQLDLEIEFDLENPAAVSFLEQHALDDAKSITSTLKDEAVQRIKEGVENGKPVDDIASSLREFVDNQDDWRAERIARTEVINGYAQGSLQGYKQSNVVSGKQWLTADDDLVDEECSQNAADGIISLDASFSSGDDAPPVHPNCRCALIPFVGNDVEQRLFSNVLDRLNQKIKETLNNIEVKEKESQKHIELKTQEIITKAKKEAEVIVGNANTQAQQEKKDIVSELKEMRDKALELVYAKEE